MLFILFGWTQKLFKLEKCLPKYAGFLLIFQKKPEITSGGKNQFLTEGGEIFYCSIEESGPHENLWVSMA